jgi:NAD(P)-dependent dehydrogenase (short-subunit alcohol dehydrogenase family)
MAANMTTLSLDGKVALITGGGKGMGPAIAKMFAANGAAIAVAARTVSQVETVASQIRADGGRAIACPTDVTNLSSLPPLIDWIAEGFGGLDIVVNCAGGGDEGRPFTDMNVADLEGSFHFNVTAPFELARLAVPHMLARPGASIINITSVTPGKSMRGHLIYDVAKAALNQLTLSLAAELGPRIRVNAILPGPTETEALREVLDQRPDIRQMLSHIIRLRRTGTPEDIANAALYLASEAASWVTGTLLNVNGGTVDEGQARFADL